MERSSGLGPIQYAWAAVTMESLNSRHLFISHSSGGKPYNQVLVDLILGMISSSSLPDPVF